MGRKHYTAEQIIRHLRQAEVLTSQGRSVSEICREIGVTENTLSQFFLAMAEVVGLWTAIFTNWPKDRNRGFKEGDMRHGKPINH